MLGSWAFCAPRPLHASLANVAFDVIAAAISLATEAIRSRLTLYGVRSAQSART